MQSCIFRAEFKIDSLSFFFFKILSCNRSIFRSFLSSNALNFHLAFLFLKSLKKLYKVFKAKKQYPL